MLLPLSVQEAVPGDGGFLSLLGRDVKTAEAVCAVGVREVYMVHSRRFGCPVDQI